MRPCHPRLARVVGSVLLTLYLASLLVVLTVGGGRLRYTADSDDTLSVWTVWIPLLVGCVLVRLVPPWAELPPPWLGRHRHRVHSQTWVLLATVVLFSALLAVASLDQTRFQVWYVGLKLVLLLAVPLVLFRVARRVGTVAQPSPARSVRLRWLAPLASVAAWAYLTYGPPLASEPGPMPDVVTVLVVFLTASVLEEVFFRMWLQTRLEILLGRWPAIAASAVAWSLWHVVIQGTGDVAVGLPNAIANQGVGGLFLGYLWARYRNRWIVILVHGAINAPLAALLAGLG